MALGQRMEISRPGDGDEVLVCSFGHRVLATPGSQVDQGPEVRCSGQLQRLARVGPSPLAPRRQDGVGVRGAAVEPQRVAEVGERVAPVGGMTANGQRHVRAFAAIASQVEHSHHVVDNRWRWPRAHRN